MFRKQSKLQKARKWLKKHRPFRRRSRIKRLADVLSIRR